ncbi:HTH-type transcriptional regulator CynR [bioreactor metagenome]|uniref:HTH-type transcriptional regulator CynR n=1 Tax=bioreactor metagenome TaxID=1076179 RepID=A0A645AVM5_9ZZZZ
MNLREQQYIYTLAKYGNITKASERLFISQPALSAFINNVESELGVKLFDRTSKGMLLTEAGEVYIRYATDMLALKESFLRDMDELRSQKTSRLRIGIQQRRASFLLPKAWRRFISVYPHIFLEIIEGTGEALMEALEGNEIDIAVVTTAELPRAYDYAELGEDKILLAMSRESLLNQYASNIEGSRYPVINLNHVREETFILQQPDQSIRLIIDTILRKAKIKPSHIIGIRNIETAVQFAGENLGVAFTRESYVRNAVQNQKVAYYYIDNNPILEKVVVIWRKNVRLTASMKVLIQALRSVYDETDFDQI